MRRFPVLLGVALATVLAAVPGSPAFSMPLRPDLIEKLAQENRLEEAREEAPQEISLLSSEALRRAAQKTPSGTVRALVLLVDFNDVPADTMVHGRRWFDRILFDAANPASMRSYFAANSYGKLDITGEIFGWFRAPQALAYYADDRRGMGNYPNNAQRLVEDAVAAADPAVDFSQFDNDGPDGIPASGDDDGVVDFLLVVHAGQGYEWTMDKQDIHSHAGSIRDRIADGVRVRAYATEPEEGEVGTFAHEFGHLLGLPDLYDVNLRSFGLGMWSLMAYGSWGGGNGSKPVGLDAWSKTRLGFIAPTVIGANFAGLELPCVEEEPAALRLWSEGRSGPQYFLVENRRAESYDSYLSNFGEGLLVYHVDERFDDNSTEGGRLVYLEQADGRFDLDNPRFFGFGSDGGDPFPGTEGNRTFSCGTSPSSNSAEGLPTEVSIKNISDPGTAMVLDVEVASPVILFNDYLVDDSGGDGDGEPDPGETVALAIRLKNYGVVCRHLAIELGTADPLITVDNPIATLDSVPGEALSGYLSFVIRLDPETPQPHNVSFSVGIGGTFAGGKYRSHDDFVLGVPLRRLAGWPQHTGNLIFSPPALADLDGDGLKEIVLGNDDGRVFAWRTDGTLLPGWPAAVGARTTSKPAVCDVDIDGKPEVIVASQEGRVHILTNDGKPHAGWPRVTGGMVRSSVALGDIDDDGLVEIICGAKDGRVYAWNEDGTNVEGWPVEIEGYEIWMSPALADCDDDHVPEVVVGGYGGKLYIFEGDGSVMPGWPVLFGWGCGGGSPTIADVDGDGVLEIAVSGLFSNSIYVVGLDGAVRHGWPRWAFNCSSLSSPVPGDLDGDGLPEIAVSTSCGTIVAWQGDGARCNALAAVCPEPIEYCEPVLADLDGDGLVEGLVGTSSGPTCLVYAFDEAGPVTGFPVEVDGGIWATMAVADLDRDNYMEIVAATTTGDVHVWRFMGAKAAGRSEWSQSRGDLWNTGYYRFEPHDNIPLPDLAVTASGISFDPARPKQGDSLSIAVKVANVGHAIASDVGVDVYYDDVDDSRVIGTVSIASLGPKSETVVSVPWRVPGEEPTRLVVVRLDGGDAVLESSELNNLARQRFYLSLPDLRVAVSGVEPFPVVVGDSVEVSALVANEGTDVARSFSVSFYDSVVSDSRCFATIHIDSLAPGEQEVLDPQLSISGFKGDVIAVWCVADRDSQVLEYHLSNNAAQFKIASGIGGELVTTPPTIQAVDFAFSRTGFVIEDASCQCVLVGRAAPPYGIIFGTDGKDVDISRNLSVFSSGGDIAAYDLKGGTSFVISATEEEETQPAVWGENVAWVSETDNSATLMLKRGAALPEPIRSAGPGAISGPDVSHDLVVWEERSEHGADIWAYDLRADTSFAVYAADGDQVNPRAWGRTVVWEDRSRDAGDIYAFDATSGEMTSVARKTGAQQHPDISGDMVVWQDGASGNWDIFGYSLAAGGEFPISRQLDAQVFPCVSESTVMWLDQRDGEHRLMGLKFGGKRAVAALRRFEALSQDAMIKVSLNIREHDDGLSYKLYRYAENKWDPEDRIPKVKEYFMLAGDSLHVYSDTLVAERRPYYYQLGVVDGYGEETITSPVQGQAFRRSPPRFVLGNPFPNPFMHGVEVPFGLPRIVERAGDTSWPDPSSETMPIEIKIYNVAGQEIRALETATLVPGYYRVSWDGLNGRGARASAGVYYLTISAGKSFASKKLILLR